MMISKELEGICKAYRKILEFDHWFVGSSSRSKLGSCDRDSLSQDSLFWSNLTNKKIVQIKSRVYLNAPFIVPGSNLVALKGEN